MEKREEDESRQYRQLMAEALTELESLHAQLDGYRRASSEPIAVVGMGCRFPAGANSPEEFWSLLRDGVDAMREIPPQRWDVGVYYAADADAPGKVYCRQAALVDQSMVEQFSPEFFGIAPREAERMDPQQRMLLEVCWEALEDAAFPADRVCASRTGVFVGSCTDDYLHLFNNLADPARIDGYTSLGTARSITVGRVAYLLGLEGPAIQLDTACSSSLVAVHQACASLRSGECDAALAGGVNLQLSPAWTIGLCKLKAIAPDGRCKTFDADADGFGRGEGCGVIVLRRLSDALADGDPIRAVIRGSAINHDGRSSGLTVPNQAAQERLLQRAIEAAKFKPDDIDYLEAHGTGTALGDPIEMGALAAVFHGRSRPLWVGSVKTNIGHLEAAAGIAGVIKVILALEHEAIPPHLHFRRPNPYIPWNEFPASIPTGQVPWSRGERPRAAGVSSFGFSGTNAHVILQEAPLPASTGAPERPCHLLTISAKSRASLDELVRRYLARLEGDDDPPLNDICFTAATGRTHFPFRLAVTADGREQLCQRLRAVLCGKPSEGLSLGTVENPSEGNRLPVWPQPEDLEQSDVARLIAIAADRYVRGLPIHWESFYRGSGGRRIALPTYPFDRRRCWPSPSGVGSPGFSMATEQLEHPLLGRRVHTAAAPQVVVFESSLSAREPSYLADHRFGDTVILPATAQLETIAAAGHTLWQGHGIVIEQVAFQSALTLRPDESRIAQTLLTPEPWGYRAELFSRPSRIEGTDSPAWVRHGSGKVTSVESVCPAVPIDRLRSKFVEEVSIAEVYERIGRQGLHYGPSFRLLCRAWRGPGEALGEVVLQEDSAIEARGYWFHPGLLDACLHVIAALPETDRPTPLLPVALQRFEILGRPGARLWSHATLRAVGDSTAATGFMADVEIIDVEGRRIARLQGLQFRELPATSSQISEPLAEAAPPPGPAPWLARLEHVPPGNRERLLVSLLRAEVAGVLGWESADRVSVKQSMLDMGMDSLGAVELQSRLQKALGCDLPLTLAIDHPNVQSLAGYIVQQLHLGTEMPTGQDDREEAADDGRRLAELSDEEVQTLLKVRYHHLF